MPPDANEFVPGTVRLVDVDEQAGKDIVLVPSPSTDPEDPLNWTRNRKILALSMVYLYNLAMGIPTSLQYSLLSDITRDTGIDTATLVQGNGLMILFFGWGPALIWQPLALTYGRRGVYLLSTLLVVPMAMWTAYSSTVGEWYAHRVLIGIIASPFEALPEVTIFDLFFAHERGAFTSVYTFVLFGSTFIAPLVAGWFNDAYGWRWTMQFGAIFAAFCFVVLFLFLEETIYFRDSVEGENTSNLKPSGASDDEERRSPSSPTPVLKNHQSWEEDITASGTISQVPPPPNPEPIPDITPENSPKGFLHLAKSFKFFTALANRPSNMDMIRMIYYPVIFIFQFPTVLWSGFLYGINLAWYNVLNGTTSPVLSAPPYNWSAALVGCVYTGPIIGAALAAAWCGPGADYFALALARRNGGIREPEHRLWPLLVSGVISAAGLILWGVGAHHNIHWIGLVFGLALMTFGTVTGGAIAISYNVDCLKEIGGESTVSVMMMRNTIGFGFSYAITPWYTSMGLQNCFIMAGIMSLVCTSTFLIMVRYGKTLRRRSTKRYLEYISKVPVNMS
ncbi:hypothetical protein ASPVEDRAFT_36137 [Aspergillus versicolor CBS 583.65]|uniref:Major facilitator superfamily (MFS) profile domain-containing protein n=1 Tax=Aspergillus versicolor CBS 583.65 TaxID=1036611 RepID=A0A1L9P5I2_ASPVE|nr:uncharacterized protein ASPVEDRAFT_36137 [Aspergillus versicolor CBS 583.65]OJI96746.1 hypothetical protein ASPVEDRAFT_36137 [Aspergillus versicolor CBS 583.65]